MDAHDIFKKLTRGVKFTSKDRNNSKKPNAVKPVELLEIKKQEPEFQSDNEIKTEPDDSSDDETLVNQTIQQLSEDEIKDEIISDEDEQMNLFDDVNLPNLIKKKKKVMTEDKLKMIEQEEVNRFRNLNKINVIGKKPPKPFDNFDNLTKDYKISNLIVENVKKCGYTSPTPIQMQAMPIMLEGRPILACAPTGSGKTASFLVPIIRDLKGPQNKGFRAVILCPTRELAKQTQRECIRLTEGIGFRIHIINKINQAEDKYGPKSSGKYDILITTPNRVCFLLNQEPALLDLKNVQWLILDEADKLFESGKNSFRDQFDQIFNACSNSDKKVALFSATYTHPVSQWCKKNLRGLLTVTIGERNTATNLVDQELLFVGSESGKLLAFRDLVRNGLQPPVLVFVQSKDRAQQLFNELIYDGINVDVIHADRTQLQRDNSVKAFREGKIWILICTELMGRGIDFKGVNLVVNYDFPPTAISYIHRIGRTGRAGRKGRAITFFTKDDTSNLRSIAQIMRNSGCVIPDYMLAMKKVSKRERRKMEKSASKRDDISTALSFELQQRKKRKDMIAGSKARKVNGTVKRKRNTENGDKNSFKKKKID